MTFNLHDESFACAGLSICKDSAVVACKNLFNKRGSNNLVYIYLLGCDSKDSVKLEVFSQGTLFNHRDFMVAGRSLYHQRRAGILLLNTGWPEKIIDSQNN